MGVKDREIDILHAADLHLAHQRVPTAHTIKALREYLLPLIPKTKMFEIAGDFFDASVSMDSSCAPQILGLAVDILMLCYGNNVAFRVLQGTYSHDRNQLHIFDKLVKKLSLPIDYAWVNTVSIEYVEKIKGYVLYLPDNLPYRNKSELFKYINDLLITNHIRSVDYVIMHGEFTHTACGHLHHDSYTIEDFKPICSKLVLTGHIHKPSKNDIVVYAGSFNRLAHNEEEAKGFWKIKGTKAEFVVNPDAMKFITVDYTKFLDLDSLIEKHKRVINKFPKDEQGYLRVIISDVHLKQALSSYHNKRHSNIKLTFKSTDTKNNSESSLYLDEKLNAKRNEVLEVPSAKNVSRIVCQHLLKQYGLKLELADVEELINGYQ